MLNRLKLTNFKAWREADLELGKVTGFFGTNSAGKSTLFQLLLLLKQTRNSTDRGLVLDFGRPEDLVNLGTFKDVVYQHKENEAISWQLEWRLPGTLHIIDGHWLDNSQNRIGAKSDHLETRCKVGLLGSDLTPYDLTYRFNEVEFGLRRSGKEGAKKPDNRMDFDLVTSGGGFKFLRQPGRPSPLPRPVKTYQFPYEVRSSYQNADFLIDFEFAYESLMDSIHYLGPLREYPQREYHWSGSSRTDVGQRGERTMDAILSATRDGWEENLGKGKKKRSFQEMIAYWLKELDLIHEFRLEEIKRGTNLYQAIVKTSASSAPTVLTDVGFGVSQVLPALVLLYYVEKGSTVLMEQPELHLHPSVQSRLADLMLTVAETRNVQIIVESHSEHLLRRLQRRVAQQEASSEDVKLFFVETKRGVARASDLALNKWGEIENWPESFFGDEMGEISAIAEASLKRKMGQSE